MPYISEQSKFRHENKKKQYLMYEIETRDDIISDLIFFTENCTSSPFLIKGGNNYSKCKEIADRDVLFQACL